MMPEELKRLDDALVALQTFHPLLQTVPDDIDACRVGELLGLVLNEIQDAFEDCGHLFALLPEAGGT